MTNAAGAKGTAWETAVVRYLSGCGLLAKRKVKKGSADQADVEVPGLEDLLVIEAKNRARVTLAEWLDETVAEAANAGVPVGACWHHRKGKGSPGAGYVTLQGDHFVHLLKELARMRTEVTDARIAVRVLQGNLDWEKHH